MKETLSKYLFLHIIFTFIKKLLLEAAEIIPLHLKKNFGFLEKLMSIQKLPDTKRIKLILLMSCYGKNTRTQIRTEP